MEVLKTYFILPHDKWPTPTNLWPSKHLFKLILFNSWWWRNANLTPQLEIAVRLNRWLRLNEIPVRTYTCAHPDTHHTHKHTLCVLDDVTDRWPTQPKVVFLGSGPLVFRERSNFWSPGRRWGEFERLKVNLRVTAFAGSLTSLTLYIIGDQERLWFSVECRAVICVSQHWWWCYVTQWMWYSSGVQFVCIRTVWKILREIRWKNLKIIQPL